MVTIISIDEWTFLTVPDEDRYAPYTQLYMDWFERVVYGKGTDGEWQLIAPMSEIEVE